MLCTPQYVKQHHLHQIRLAVFKRQHQEPKVSPVKTTLVEKVQINMKLTKINMMSNCLMEKGNSL